MKVNNDDFEGVAIIQMHLNGGFNKVLLESKIGVGIGRQRYLQGYCDRADSFELETYSFTLRNKL